MAWDQHVSMKSGLRDRNNTKPFKFTTPNLMGLNEVRS